MSRHVSLLRAAVIAAFVVFLSAPAAAQLGVPSFTHPSNGTTLNSDIIFCGSCDPASTQIEIQIDGANVGTATLVGGTQWGFQVSGLADGSHSAEARASDGVTTTAWSTTVNFSVDSTMAPARPGRPYGASPTASAFTFEWQSVAGAVSYNVYRDMVLLGTTTNPNYAESTTLSDGSYSYAVGAVDNAGRESSYSPTRFVEQNAAWPANVLKVGLGYTEGFAEISEAAGWITSHSMTNVTILVSSGTYQGFTAAQGFRLFTVPGETVFIDTTTNPLILAGGAQTEPYELVGLQFGSVSAVQLSINACTLPVVVENCLFSGSTATGVAVTSSREVALHQCSIGGVLPVSISGYSFVAMNGGDMTTSLSNAVFLSQASHLVCTGTFITGAINNTAGSIVDQLAGTVMRLTADCTVTEGSSLPIAFEGAANQPWGLATHLTTTLQYTMNPDVIIDGALLLDLTSVTIIYEGTTNITGFDVPVGSFPVDPYFSGYAVQLQGVGWEPSLGIWRLSNEVTVVPTP